MKKNTLKVVLWICALLVLVLAIAFPSKEWAYIVELVLSLAIIGTLAYEARKEYNAAKVVLIALIGFMIFSWIVPAAYYSGQYVEQGRVQMGLFDLFNYPLTALSYFGYIAFYFILVGGFYGILYKIPAYRSLLDKIVEKADGKEKIVLSIMVIVISLLVSVCGLHFGIAILIPFVVAIILLMGYDKIVAAMVTVGSIGAGLIGSTYAYNNLSVMLESFGLKYDYQIGIRFVLLAVGVALVIFNMLMYIKRNLDNVRIEKKTVKKVEEKVVEVKVTTTKTETKKPVKKSSNSRSNSSKKSTSKSSKSKSRRSDNKAALKDEDIIVVRDSHNYDDDLVPTKVSKGHKFGVLSVLLFLLFVILVLAFFTWGDNGFKIKLFDDMTTAVTKFELFKFPIFGKILGTVNAFGSWSLTDMFLPMMLVALLSAFIYQVPADEVLDGFVAGAKKALSAAAIVILVYSVLVLVTYHPFQTVIYKVVLGWSKKFNIFTTTIVSLLAGLFNSDISYSFQSVIPYYVSVVKGLEENALAAIIFQSMYGLSTLVMPTSLILLGTLSYLGVSYKDWLKNSWKLLLELFVVLLIVFIVLAL